jgi:nucleoside triphosphate pyrophosphatase
MDNRNAITGHYGISDPCEIILASQSPRRKQLLEWAEVTFKVVIVPTDESYPADLPIEEVPVHIAKQKAYAVAAKQRGDAPGRIQSGEDPVITVPRPIIIAADTIVVADGKIIGKPGSRQQAFEILSTLSGTTHEVITGVCIKGRTEITFSDKTFVEFHTLTHEQIWFYIDKYKPYDKAGAYGIQEWIGVTGIRCIRGDFYNVMGLPVSRVLQALKSVEL